MGTFATVANLTFAIVSCKSLLRGSQLSANVFSHSLNNISISAQDKTKIFKNSTKCECIT